MSGTIITGTYPDGVSLDAAGNPATIGNSARLSSTGSAALYGAAAVDWSITNFGIVQGGGTGTLSNGVALAGSGTVTNFASISGYYGGVSLGASGLVINDGDIAATATGSTAGAGVRMAGGSITNDPGDSITGNFIGIFLTSGGSADNAGVVAAGGTGGSYGLGIQGAGGVTNAATGTITDANVGVVLTGLATVTNFGSIGSTANNNAGQLKGYEGVDLRVGGTITNAYGARISSQWIGVQIGYQGTSFGGTVINDGTIFAGNSAGDAGAAVWVHGPGVVLNGANGTIEGGPYGIVAYYDTTIVNSGSIFGTDFAVLQSSTAASNLVEMAPGASFSGIVEGGSTAASAAAGTLELLAGSGAGAIGGFGTQYVGFGEVLVNPGADWSLAGTVASGQSLTFGGPATLTLENPTTMSGTIFGFVPGDSIVLSGITGITSATADASDQLVVSNGSGPVVTLQLDPSRHDPTGKTFGFAQSGNATVLMACFAAGTRIATDAGDIEVQALAAGMRVRSPFGGSTPIVWLGHRRTDCRRHPRPHDVWPVRIAADAFGPGQPLRDLWLSPDHAVFSGGVLVPVRYLVNGRTIAQVETDEIDYWHVELPRHDVLLAEGLPCESFLDTGNRAAFANGGAATMLHPDFSLQVWRAKACAELVRDGARLTAARRLLLDRAMLLGHALTDQPLLSLSAGGRPVKMSRDGRRYHAADIGGRVRLRSRTWIPAHTTANERDHRVLGVAISGLRFADVPVPLDDPRLAAGWHAPEAAWRWTNGDAVLDLEGRGALTFTLALPGRYWVDAPDAERRAG